MWEDEEEAEDPEFDASVCFPIQDGGFSFRKSFTKMNNKKLSGTIDFRLKTCVTKALLKENACDERKLQKSIGLLTQHQNQRRHSQNHQQLSFTFHMNKKRESWKREDRSRVDRLNFPHLSANDRKLKSASMQQVYRTPDSYEQKGVVCVPLHPVMYGRTEPRIVQYNNHTYLAKHPVKYELHPRQQRRYDNYRGVDLLASRSVLDKRFQGLSTALSEAKLTVGTGKRPHTDLPGGAVKPRSQFFPDLHTSQLTTGHVTRAATTLR